MREESLREQTMREQAMREPPRAPGVFPSVLQERCLAALLLALPLSLFGELLLLKTHHRPLGAATFASVALVAFALASRLTWRLSSQSRSQSGLSRSKQGRSKQGQLLWGIAGVGLLVAIGRLLG